MFLFSRQMFRCPPGPRSGPGVGAGLGTRADGAVVLSDAGSAITSLLVPAW